MNNYYFVLGVSPDATADQVRHAYMALAKKFHPDKNRSPDATIKMSEINLAYETLRDSQRRQKYDLENGITVEDKEDATVYRREEEIGQEEPSPLGKCVRCNFDNSSGLFVCSVCGYTFDPRGKNRKNADGYYDDNDDDITSKDIESPDNMSEIIRCPQCNKINMYSRGSCWQCGLEFEMDEAIT